ncbi:MAG: hypothetical protein O3B13_08800 [Planctomycetota bacterium]|nr:hypothetical protein [Planctomycetota bacterium]MDA1163186.1 hypothetical protein [Planctomycetota bacterium]
MTVGSGIPAEISSTAQLPVESASILRERRIHIAAIWIACVAFVCGLTIADPDLWGHTLYGVRANEQGTFAETYDPFSYTAPGGVWVNHEWMSESQFGWLWQRLGNVGLVAWRNAWCLVVFAVAFLALKRASASLPAALLLLVLNAEVLSDFMVFVRPQMATFGLFALFLLLLKRFRDEQRVSLLLPMPVLMVFWVNHHGGFLAGIGVFGITVAAMSVRCLRSSTGWSSTFSAAAVLGLTILATFVNPYGVGLHEMLWDHLWTPQFVREWQPLWSVNQSPVYYVPFLVTAIALCGSRRWTIFDALVLAVVAWEAISHVRHVALFCIATMVLLPEPLSDSLTRLFPNLARQWSGEARRPLRIAAVVAAILFLTIVNVRGSLKLWIQGITPLSIAAETRSDVPGIPLGAISFIARHDLSGNLLTDYGWGQYVIWHLHSRVRVAFDGRYRTVYPADVERKFLEFQTLKFNETQMLNGVATTPMLDEFGTDIVLLPNDRGPVAYMNQRPDWRLVYRDGQASIFVRNDLQHEGLIARCESQPDHELTLPTWIEFPAAPLRQANNFERTQRTVFAGQSLNPDSSIAESGKHHSTEPRTIAAFSDNES